MNQKKKINTRQKLKTRNLQKANQHYTKNNNCIKKKKQNIYVNIETCTRREKNVSMTTKNYYSHKCNLTINILDITCYIIFMSNDIQQEIYIR